MAILGDTLSVLKAKSPLRGVNLFPGEVSYKLGGVTSQNLNRALGYIPEANSNYAVSGADVIKLQKDNNQTPYNPQYDQWAQQQIAGASGSGGGSGYQQVQSPGTDGNAISNIYESAAGDQQMIREQQLAMINDEFGKQVSYLNQLEGNVVSAYDTSRQNVESAYNTAEGAIRSQTATTKEGLGMEKQRAETESAKDLTRTRQRLSDLQRRQNAYMSATGGYGSESTQAALAESFGRQAQQGLSDVTTRRDQALQDINFKMRQADDFAQTKIAELATNKAGQLAQLEQQKNADLASIANNRNMAESAKAQAAFSTWRDFYDNKRNIELAAAQWEQSVQQWRQQTLSEAQSSADTIANMTPDELMRYFTNDTAMTGVVPEAQVQPGGTSTSYAAPVRFSGESDDDYMKRLYGKLSPNQLAGYGMQSQGVGSGVTNLFNQRSLS